jgi:hypothetical protein
VLQSRAFVAASTVGVYIHCARLREVDTMAVLGAALDAGGAGETTRVQRAGLGPARQGGGS